MKCGGKRKMKRKRGGLSRGKMKGSYRWFICCRDGKKVLWSRAVYQNYILNGIEIPDGIIVHHKDRNTENDLPENLIGKTRGQHVGEHHIGIKRPDVSERNSIIKPEQMLGIKNPMFGKKRPEVGERNKLIKLGNKNNAKLTGNEVADIKRLLRENNSAKYIADIYKVSVPTIRAIKSGRVWKEID